MGFVRIKIQYSFLYPYRCLLITIKRIQQFDVHLSAKLYDLWMEKNGGNNQVGSSAQAMQLWQVVVKYSFQRLVVDVIIVSIPLSKVLGLQKCCIHEALVVKIEWNKVKVRMTFGDFRVDKGKTNS